MKKKNIFIMIAIMAVAVIGLVGCVKKYTISVSTQDLWFGLEAGSQTLDITANCEWTVTKNDDGTKVGFALVESGVTIPANKAFYLSSTADAGIFYSIGDIDNEGTGIATLTQTDESEQAIYNLQGARVKNASKGIYIINGKKVIIK